MADPRVQAEIAKLQLSLHLIAIAEAWGFGFDGVDDQDRQYQVSMQFAEQAEDMIIAKKKANVLF